MLIGGWVVLLALLSARTVRRNQDWQSDETLYRSGVSLNPPKGKSRLLRCYSCYPSHAYSYLLGRA